MATIRVLLGIICLAAIGRGGLFGGDLLAQAATKMPTISSKDTNGPKSGVNGPDLSANGPKWSKTFLEDLVKKQGKWPWVMYGGKTRHRGNDGYESRSALQIEKAKLVLKIAGNQLGVYELTGKNDGVWVERYLGYVGLQKGAPWCAAFVSWVFGQAGYPLPRTAWSPALFPLSRQMQQILPGTVFGIYFPEVKRIAHCGLVKSLSGHWVHTIEGNTSVAGSREGDGVYARIRHQRTIQVYADWMVPVRKGAQP